jgi:pimeloyl-ACP methyl ester carboxylesterase
MTHAGEATLPRWRTGTVESGGEDIYYEVVEAGTPQTTVVLTHGAGGSHAVWYQQVAALAGTHRVITWDARGFGNSTYRTGTHGVDVSADDLAAVLEATGTTHAHVVGQSMGGWFVTAFALAHPECVRSLTLTNTIGGLWTEALDEHFADYVGRAEADARARAVRGEDGTRIGRHPAVGDGHTGADLAHAFLYQQLNTFHSPPAMDVLPALVTTRVAHDDVRALGAPLLVVTGTDDPIFPPELVRDCAQRIGAEIVEIEGAGHSPYWERPAEFNAALTSFVARADALAQGTVAELE